MDRTPVFQLILAEPEAPVRGPDTRLVQLDCFSHELGKTMRPEIAGRGTG